MYLKNDRIFIALSIMLDIAFYAGTTGIVNGVELADRTGFLRRGIEPLLQSLTKAGLLESIRGPKGGYRLSYAANMIILKDIISAIHKGKKEERVFIKDGHKEKKFLTERIIFPLWSDCNKILEEYFQKITLGDLLEKARDEGFAIPSDVPIFFSI